MQQQSNPKLPEEENPQAEPEVYAVYWHEGKAKISRRSLLKAGGALMAGAALAGCASGEKRGPEWNCEDAIAHENPVTGLAFTPDSHQMMSHGESEFYLKLWSFPDSQTCKILESGGTPVGNFVISPQGDYAYCLVPNKTVQVWSLPDGEQITSFVDPGYKNGEPSIYLSPNCQYLVIAYTEQTRFSVFEVPSGKLLYELKHGERDYFLHIKFSPQSGYLVSFSYDGYNGNATVWSLADGKKVRTFQLENHIQNPSFNKDDSFFIFPDDRVVNIYSLPDGKLMDTLYGHAFPITDHTMFKNSNQLITGDVDGVVKIWSVGTGEEEYSFQIDRYSRFKINEELQILTIINDDTYRISLYSLLDGTEIETFEYTQGYGRVDFSPDKNYLYMSHQDVSALIYVVKVYDLQQQAVVNESKFTGYVMVAFSPDSRFLVTGDEKGRIHLYSLEDGQQVSCMVDLSISSEDLEGIEYSIEEDGITVTYTLPCGSPIPEGAACVCNCVSGAGCACVSDSGGGSADSHYWYPN